MAAFANNSMVAFGDVNLAEDRSIGGEYNAGVGGWPTIRYFNPSTGVKGERYTKKTTKAMCDELGDDKFMRQYIAEAGSTSACVLATRAECTERELEYAQKMGASSRDDLSLQRTRLRGMASKSMKPELKEWVGCRLNVIAQLQASLDASSDELGRIYDAEAAAKQEL